MFCETHVKWNSHDTQGVFCDVPWPLRWVGKNIAQGMFTANLKQERNMCQRKYHFIIE